MALKSKFQLVFFLTVLAIAGYSQPLSTLIIQPGPNDGYDAPIRALPLDSAQNRGTYEYIRSSAWTHLGDPYVWKTLIDYPALDSILQADHVGSAELVLYADRAFTVDNGGQFATNTSVLSLVTEPWDEDLVVWNTQPTYDPSVNVEIPANNNYDSITVDITPIVEYCRKNNLPFYGLILEPLIQTPFRSSF